MRPSILAVILVALTAQAPPGAAVQERADRRNVLLVIADDLNCHLACYGQRRVHSPNLDRLAAKGVRFERAYAQYPGCCPSRASFLTGLRPETTKVFNNHTNFRQALPDVLTLPQLFRRNGYVTAGLGKVFHRGPSSEEEEAGMEDLASWDHRFYGRATEAGRRGEGRNLTEGRLPWCRWLAAEGGDEDLPDGQTTAEAIRLMEKHRGKPFFMAIGFYRPHDPFHSPRKYYDLYPLDQLQPPALPADRTPELRYALPGKAFDGFGDRERREFMRAYYAGISFMDAQVGRLLDALERHQLADKTIVVFLSDHGYHLGERGWWNKGTLFESSCRAPLIVHVPGARGNGRTARGLVEYVDLYPSLAGLCGLAPPAGLEGTSFQPLLDDPGGPGKPAATTLLRIGDQVTGRTARTNRWRYTEWNGGSEGVELYDHDADPGEWRNLAGDPEHAGVRAELRRSLR